MGNRRYFCSLRNCRQILLDDDRRGASIYKILQNQSAASLVRGAMLRNMSQNHSRAPVARDSALIVSQCAIRVFQLVAGLLNLRL
jgi:hypothetical protein